MPVPESLKLFVRGPVWRVGAAVSLFATAIGIAELVGGGGAVRVLAALCVAQFALLVATFWSFHKLQSETHRRQTELPQALESLLADGIEALDRMVAAQKADPQRMGPWGEQIDEAWEFFGQARCSS